MIVIWVLLMMLIILGTSSLHHHGVVGGGAEIVTGCVDRGKTSLVVIVSRLAYNIGEV
jgi:hypothetical protein